MKKLALLALVSILLESTGYSGDFFCAAGNVGCLISAIGVANGNGQDNSIFLEDGIYTLTAVDNMTDGPTGLPIITGRLRIVGPYNIGSTIERDPAGPFFRIFQIAAGGNLALDWLGLRGGTSGSGACGGAIFNEGTLTINRSAIYNNNNILPLSLFKNGGAICSTGILSVTNSEIHDNVVSKAVGGGIFSSGILTVEDSVFYQNSAVSGGGIYSSGSGFLMRTTFSNNFGIESAGITNIGSLWIESSSIHDGHGAGIFNGAGTLTIVNTSILQNEAEESPSAGGISNSGNLFMKNASVVANLSFQGAAGIQDIGGTTRLQNSILALNTSTHSGFTTAADCDSSIASFGNNVFGSLNGCSVVVGSSDFIGDPGLGPFTEDVLVPGSGHVPPMPGSPAINHGNDGACTPTDQLGEHRNGPCDIGAVEFQPSHEEGHDQKKHGSNQDDRRDGDQHGSDKDHR